MLQHISLSSKVTQYYPVDIIFWADLWRLSLIEIPISLAVSHPRDHKEHNSVTEIRIITSKTTAVVVWKNALGGSSLADSISAPKLASAACPLATPTDAEQVSSFR
ncbi:hypothetical protein N7445_008797 [Penicillium cf. griseofulvum]|nr:hypothetical protein N7445_008797 [Penicillium cf. griseofulvum]